MPPTLTTMQPPSPAVPSVSVVIPTYARPGRLRDCLDALAHTALPQGDFEVVVVDDGSPDPLDGIVAPFAGRMEVRLLRQENAGPAAARNRGVREAAAALVAFTDDDCRPRPDWLPRLLEAGRARPGAMVGGATDNGLPEEVLAATSQAIVDLVYEHFNADHDRAYFLTSNNILLPRDRFLELGGFDATFIRAGAEDRDFCDRWRSAGWPIAWRPEARIDHFHSQSLRGFVDLHWRYGRGAHRYQHKRRVRGSGTMKDDLGFHAGLVRRLPRVLGRTPGLGRRAGVLAALGLWQIVNAAGFFAEALSGQRD